MVLRSTLKLSPRFYGPYEVLQRVGQVAYRLELPPALKVHPIFHLSQLRKHIGVPVAVGLPVMELDTSIENDQPKKLLGRRIVK